MQTQPRMREPIITKAAKQKKKTQKRAYNKTKQKLVTKTRGIISGNKPPRHGGQRLQTGPIGKTKKKKTARQLKFLSKKQKNNFVSTYSKKKKKKRKKIDII